jgi:hypothetical protein
MFGAMISLAQAMKKRPGDKFSVNCKIVEKKTATEFVIADDSESLNLFVKETKTSQARYFVEEKFIRIVNPGIDKSNRQVIIGANTAVFLGNPITSLVSGANGPASEVFIPLSDSFGLDPRMVNLPAIFFRCQ